MVEFYTPGEVRHTVQLAEGSSTPGYVKGQEVTVLYDPAEPTSARIKSLGSALMLWVLPVITGFLGLAFVAAALLSVRFLRSE
jgi:hypothetical protein